MIWGDTNFLWHRHVHRRKKMYSGKDLVVHYSWTSETFLPEALGFFLIYSLIPSFRSCEEIQRVNIIDIFMENHATACSSKGRSSTGC